MSSDDEAERIRQWKEQLAAEGDSDESSDDAADAAFFAQRGIATGAPPQPEATFAQDFGAAETIEELNAMLILKTEMQAEEIARLSAMVKKAVEGDAMLGVRDVKDAKLASLTKRNRAMLQELGKERATVVTLRATVADLEEKLVGAPKAKTKSAVAAATASTVDSAPLKRANARAADLRHQLDLAKAQLQKMNAVLLREVGDNVPLDQIIEGKGSWKGRAEQISLLKDKLRASPAATPRVVSTGGSLAEKQRATLAAIESNRAADVDSLTTEVARLKEKMKEQKRRYDAATSRVKVLEVQVKKHKEHIQILLNKSTSDDQLIAALKAELAKGAPARPGARAAPAADDATVRMLEHYKVKFREHEEMLAAKDAMIADLQAGDAHILDTHGRVKRPSSAAVVAERDQLAKLTESYQQRINELLVQVEEANAARHQAEPASARRKAAPTGTPEAQIADLEAKLAIAKTKIQDMRRATKLTLDTKDEEVRMYRSLVAQLQQ